MAEAGPSSTKARAPAGVDTCRTPGCQCCLHIWKGANRFESTATRKLYKITQPLTCKTPSVVYIIQCKKCPMQYVGTTSTTLQEMVEEHRASIIDRLLQPIPDHFNSSDHCIEHLIVYPIEQVNSSKALNERELYWIRELETVAHGLNFVPHQREKHRAEETVPETAPMAEAGPPSRKARAPTGVDDCKAPGCICCKHIRKGAENFQSTATGRQYKITQPLTCKTPSVIYIIQCAKCPVQCVEKTSTTLQSRFTHLRSSIRHFQHRPVSDHFNSDGHCLDDLTVCPIERMDDSEALKERELHWIAELETLKHGLNVMPKCGRTTSLSPQKGKRKICGNDDQKSKKSKRQDERLTVFTYETEELLSKCEDAFGDGKEAISQIASKLLAVSCTEKQSISFLDELKKKISGLKVYDQKKKIYIGLFGKTGAGKSSLINAIVKEKLLLPSGSSHACTSVFVYVQTNTESRKYRADVEFISAEDWKSELHFLLELLKNENDSESMAEETAEDDELVKMAKEKITAIYGQEGLKKDYSALVGARDFPEVLSKGMKPQNFDTAKELSQSIGRYIRSDRKGEQQLWPLVKRVTISLPNSPALLEGIVLVDLPGAGDVNKHRSEMWKECLSQCSSVWIVNDINRALSEKVANEIFDKSLRTIAGGGECHNITFICTKTDDIDLDEMRENITDNDLERENDTEDTQDHEKRVKRACILLRNKRLKEDVNEFWREKAKKFLLGDEGNADGVFDVFTVSSTKYWKNVLRKPTALDYNETELPSLMEHIKKLYVSHFVKEVKDYISEVSGIISYLHFSKEALSSKVQFSNLMEFNRLEKTLDGTCKELNLVLGKVHTELRQNLQAGAKTAERDCLKNATESVLKPTWCDNRGHHQTLKALCRNDGCYRSGTAGVIDLNYTLSEPMYRKMNDKDLFLRTFGSGASRSSIHGHFASFQEAFVTNELLKYHRKKNKEKYLRLVYIRTEQRKLLKNLEKEILNTKKLIYNSLSDSICDTMMPTYQECTKITGKMAFTKIKDKLLEAIGQSKNAMFLEAMKNLLQKFIKLQAFLVDEIRTQMTISLSVALNQIPDDLTGLPDVSEEMKKMERCCDSLDLQVF